jgi:hypothetical protein
VSNTSESKQAGSTSSRPKSLARCEKVIERGTGSYIEVGEALAEIREHNLFAPYADFDVYCGERWGFTSRYARDHINGAPIGRVFRERGTIVPLGQARALIPLASEPEKIVKLYDDLRQQLGRPPVARELADEVKLALAKKQLQVSDDPQAELVKQFRDRASKATNKLKDALDEIVQCGRGIHHNAPHEFTGFITGLTDSLRALRVPDFTDDKWWEPILDLSGPYAPRKTGNVHDQVRLLHQEARAAGREADTKQSGRRRPHR